MKRFTETTKWNKPWFRALKPEFKLLWIYLCDNCDSAGIWEGDKELAQFQIGMPIDWDLALSTLNTGETRISVISTNKWFILAFVNFQYGELSVDCKPHQKVISLLKKYTLPIPFTKGMQRDKEEEEEEEEDKDKEEGVKREVLKAYSLRINDLFNRRESTEWSNDEKKQLKALSKRKDFTAEIVEIEKYYRSDSPILRHNIVTLLNNWVGELDRARSTRPKTQSFQVKAPPIDYGKNPTGMFAGGVP